MAKKGNYDNTNRGVLFVNDRKESDTQPDYTGSLNVDGVEFFLNAWKPDKDKKGKGKPVLRLSVKQKEKIARGDPRPAPKKRSDDFDDDNDPF